MKTKNNYPSSEFEHEDKCPSCGSPCNIHTDLDDNDECKECRNQIDGLEMGQIIPKEEPKQETLEEAAEKFYENWEEITGLDYENTVPSEVNKLDFINGAKWQQEQNKNLYSEEEVSEIIDSLFHRYASSFRIDAKEYFLQFKKK